jgi:hypothetical protein
MNRLTTGDPAPSFIAPAKENDTFRFATLAGRWVVLAFVPDLESLARLKAAAAGRPELNQDEHIVLFGVVPAPLDVRFPPRCFADPDGTIAASYGAATPQWILLDPTLRVFAQGPISEPETLLRLATRLPAPGGHAGAPLNAPVLLVPRVFEPGFCRTLIDVYRAQGGKSQVSCGRSTVTRACSPIPGISSART